MLRAPAHHAHSMRSQTALCTAATAIAGGSGLLGMDAVALHCGPPTATSSLHGQRRYSFKYATKRQHNEVRQPFFIHEKRYGLFSNEHNIAKPRRGLPHITPIYTKHMNLWETDTDASTNRFFRSYVFGQRDLHILLGRPHGFEADQAGGQQGYSAYELNTDQRYKGVPRPAITNLHYEPQWNQTLYRNAAHGNALANPTSALTAAVLGPELMEIRDIKSVEHCKAWFDRLAFLIQQHYDAVGDIGEFRSRHTQHVHEFFVAFHDALSSFDFQDAYLFDQFVKVRPQKLEDLFAIFMEMEANYVNEDYCPRCSLPYATTHYCGEGDPNTPFRRHRGRWAPHQQWGREWYDVVMRRAEALWYRATEDPYFGTAVHTQRQVEALVSVYVKTKHRAKLVDFLNAIRGSKEFLMSQVTITPAMQQMVDGLLDSTAHQHLLTNAHTVESRVAKYTGDAQSVPHSPLQMRLDMEMNKYRRQQREEGVVRVPPAAWKLDTSAIVPYKVDPQTKRVTNWREVKAGIEKSFLSTGLPQEAYTSQEWREMLYLRERIASRGARRAQLEGERQAAEAAMVDKYGSSSASAQCSWRVFPDKDWYRVYETSAEALRPFGVKHSGETLLVRTQVYPDPAAVPYTDPARNVSMMLDTTPEACAVYGGFESGEVVQLTPHENTSSLGQMPPASAGAFEVVIVGVDKSGAESEWALYAMHRDASVQTNKGLLNLGTDCHALLSNFAKVESTEKLAPVTVLDTQRTVAEDQLGQVVGVRKGMLYMQWHLQRGGSSELDRSVATPLGTPEMVKQLYQLRALPEDATKNNSILRTVASSSLQEPPSWRTPFRNDFVDERLKELEEAPFQREQWASLIKNKYTPKVKKFGYTQHSTQDDFQTKEYKDRLLARQFFTNPQAFAIIPEKHERSVKFMGKWEHQRVSGLPTVDRNELERGWGEAEEISDAEVDAIEQALRDISGRRPGNFLKSPTETQSLRLNESWWTPLEYGWEQHNREQRAFLDSSERRIIESSRLPFGGKRPPFGTTYGIGERISEIAADYSKGFGLGPHGHSPQHDTSHYNTLDEEQQRVQRLGLDNVLVRLFHEKLGNQDIQTWASQQCSESDANVRHLLLSVEEWRTKGRAPSLLLCNVLRRYLKDELELFNSGLPAGVPRLAVPTATHTSNSSNAVDGAAAAAAENMTSDGNIWADVDRTAFALAHADQFPRGDSGEPYIIGLVQNASIGCSSGSAAAASTDTNYAEYIQQDVLQRFQANLARIIGRGIPESTISERTAKNNRGLERASGNVTTLVRVQELAKLLAKMRVAADSISLVVRGLAQCPEKELLNGLNDFAVPVSLVLSWTGPSSNSASRHVSSRGSSAHQQTFDGARQRGGNSTEKMVVEVLEELSWTRDGRAADILYTIQQNKVNPTLRQEFMNAFLPVYENNFKKVQEKFDDYAAGKFVPNITVAIEAFVKFLANISKHPEQLTSAVAYFEKDETKRLDGSGATGQYTQIRLLPPHIGPFQFESTLIESIETADQFRRYGIQAGPMRAPVTGFIAANCKSLTYRTHRERDIVYVTSADDQGLSKALRASPAFKDITSNPALAHLLKESNGHQYPGLITSFNRFFYRVAPMLSFYQNVLRDYAESVPLARVEAQAANSGLARALDSEASTTIEQDFRRNAERYWRNVLEGRNAEEVNLMGDGGGGHASSSAIGRRSTQQGGGGSNSNQRGGSSMSNSILANAIGRRPSASAAAAAATSADGADVGSADRTSSSNSSTARRGGISHHSTASDVKSLLGALKGSAKGGSGSQGGRSSNSNNKRSSGGNNRQSGSRPRSGSGSGSHPNSGHNSN